MLKIFCEGVSDQVFIADFIEFHFNVHFERTIEKKGGQPSISIRNSEIEITPIDGCTNIHQLVIKKMFIDNTELGGTNLLVFDSDYTGVNGNNGFSNCLTMIEGLKNNNENPILFHHFLWPNNKEDGLFEDLLGKMIPEEKYCVMECIETHLSCLASLKSHLPIKVPGIKDKINSYLYLFNQSTKQVERTYKNDFWHFDTAKCADLLVFKEFLLGFINPTST